MRPAKDEPKNSLQTTKIELEIDKTVAEQLQIMTDFTKIPKAELVTTALKRFIATHKDYFPENR